MAKITKRNGRVEKEEETPLCEYTVDALLDSMQRTIEILEYVDPVTYTECRRMTEQFSLLRNQMLTSYAVAINRYLDRMDEIEFD